MDNPSPVPAPGAPQVPFPSLPASDGYVEPVSAGFWIRAGAYMIDGALLMLGQMAIGVILYFAGIPNFLASLVTSLLAIGYFVWMPVACAGQTVGKMAAGIAIKRMDGSPLTYLRCLGRWASYILAGLPLFLGFVAAAFTDKKRGLHDLICDTRVVYIKEIGALRKTAVILMGFFPLFLGILAALAIPKLAQLIQSSKEAETKGRLAFVRSALAVHYGDSNGSYPSDLSALVPKHLPALEPVKVKEHPETAAVQAHDATVCLDKRVDPAKVQDTGGWGYVGDPQAPCFGAVFVDCTHTDSKGSVWASY